MPTERCPLDPDAWPRGTAHEAPWKKSATPFPHRTTLQKNQEHHGWSVPNRMTYELHSIASNYDDNRLPRCGRLRIPLYRAPGQHDQPIQGELLLGITVDRLVALFRKQQDTKSISFGGKLQVR